MKKRNHRKSRLRNAAVAATGHMVLGLLILNSGCGRPESESITVPLRAPEAASAPVEASAAAIPAPDVPANAPVLQDVHPALSSGALRLARLTELPDGILLQAEGVSLTQGDVDQEIAQVPSAMRDQMRNYAFLMVEQLATRRLLVAQARRATGQGAQQDEDRLLQQYFEGMTRAVSVTDAEINAFYQENRALVGDAPLQEIKPRIRDHLRQEQQEKVVEDYIRDLGEKHTIALSASWVESQAVAILDNPLDKARASGKPTFASFGADSCIPCQMMKPAREAIQVKYGDVLNVVYVHVNKDQMLASRYGVRGIPQVMFFNAAGEEVYSHTGMMTQEQIEEWLGKIGVNGV